MRSTLTAGVVLGLSALAVSGASIAQERQPVTDTDSTAARNDRIIIYGMAPIPDVGEGAPRFSSKDIEALADAAKKHQADVARDARACGSPAFAPCVSDIDISPTNTLGCAMDAYRRVLVSAQRAEVATRAAENARRDLSAGEGTLKQAEDAEIARQAAVNEMEKWRQKVRDLEADIGTMQKLKMMRRSNVDSLDIMMAQMNRARKGYDIFAPPAEHPPGLRITNVRAIDRTDKKGTYTAIFGDIRNDGSKAAKIPDLSAALVDDKGWVLHKAMVSPSNKGSIRAGKSYSFGLEVRPAADATTIALVTFAAKDAPPPRLSMRSFCRGVFD